jgi:parallel beta-helix repeat protein
MKRNKEVLLIAVFFIVLILPYGDSSTAIVFSLQNLQNRSILYVGGTGPGNYSRIQDAIDNASDGDVVFVYADSAPYNETIWINVSISLLGEHRDSTIINGKEDMEIIRINRDNVAVQGFTLQGIEGDFSGRGIKLLANNSVISDNIFKYTSMGIYAISNYSSFTKNEFSSLNRGMWLLYSHHSQITDNNFGFNSDEDITVGGTYCYINNNTFAGKYGLKVWKSNQTTISDNTFLNSCIIDFYESCYNTVCCNTFENGSFSVYRSNHNSVFNNTRDGVPIAYLDGAKDKTIENAAQVILVLCENIAVRGITFTDIPCGIYLENTKNSNISGNTFSNCAVGVSLSFYCRQNIIANCQFNACSHGIILGGNSNLNSIVNNTITTSDEAAIIIDGPYNRICYNTISNATLGISLTSIHPYQQPTYANYRRRNAVYSNMVRYAQYGIVVDAFFTNVKNNRVADCEIGIGITDLAPFSFEVIKGNVIEGNSMENNQQGLVMDLTVFTIVQKNNFISNEQQASFLGVGLFGQIVGTRWRRNYWGETSVLPKAIPGDLYIPTGYSDKISYTKIHWVEFDWLPAQQPYSLSMVSQDY